MYGEGNIFNRSYSTRAVERRILMNNLKFYLITLFFSVKPALNREVGKKLSRRIRNRMKRYYIEIDKRKSEEKGIMKFHRMFLITGLSLYRAMRDESGEKYDPVETIHKMFSRSRMFKFVKIAAFFVRRSKDPYNSFLLFLGPRNERFFPCPPWEKVEIDLVNGTGWRQNKCPFHAFFKDEGANELTKAYCDLDKRIVELVSGHIKLKRQHTLANGDDWCDFYYYQT